VVLPLIALAGLESPAGADRWTIGASIARSEGEGGADLFESRGVFARMRLAQRLSVEAELSGLRVDGDVTPRGGYSAERGLRGTANLRYDLSAGTFVPYLVYGGGIDNWKGDWIEWGYARQEGGVGVDLAVSGGLRLGADIRWGRLYYLGANQTEDIAIQLYIAPPFGNDRTDYVATRLTLSAAL
jgi:hypothetical protein